MVRIEYGSDTRPRKRLSGKNLPSDPIMSYRYEMEEKETDELLDIYRRLSRDMKRDLSGGLDSIAMETIERAMVVEQILRRRGKGDRVEATARAVQNERM